MVYWWWNVELHLNFDSLCHWNDPKKLCSFITYKCNGWNQEELDAVVFVEPGLLLCRFCIHNIHWIYTLDQNLANSLGPHLGSSTSLPLIVSLVIRKKVFRLCDKNLLPPPKKIDCKNVKISWSPGNKAGGKKGRSKACEHILSSVCPENVYLSLTRFSCKCFRHSIIFTLILFSLRTWNLICPEMLHLLDYSHLRMTVAVTKLMITMTTTKMKLSAWK